MKGLANVGLFINPIFGFVWYSAAHDTGCMRLYSSTEHWEKGAVIPVSEISIDINRYHKIEITQDSCYLKMRANRHGMAWPP